MNLESFNRNPFGIYFTQLNSCYFLLSCPVMPEKRQLAAIMFTDIVGYTKMMGEDENIALSVLRKNRDIHKKMIAEYHGQFLKEMGDGVLASFENSSDAVICAASIMKTANEKDLTLRIGIHMGEVIFENKDVFGDGVNIASRIEALAEPNQILVSETIHHNVQNKTGITTHQIGARDLKGVEKALLIFQAIVHDEFLIPRKKAPLKKSANPVLFGFMGVLIIVIAWGGGYWIGQRSKDPPRVSPVIRYNIDMDANLWRTGRQSLYFSPDGKYLCYVTQRQMFLKSMDDPGRGDPIMGDWDPRGVCVSPDGKWVAFEDMFTGYLVKVSVIDGNTSRLCPVASYGIWGTKWNENGIYFSMSGDIYMVSEKGGTPEKIYPINSDEVYAMFPQILPDNKTLIFTLQLPEDDQTHIAMTDLKSKENPIILIERGSDARFLSNGHLAFIKDKSLQLVGFDPISKEIIGSPQILISEGVTNGIVGQFAFNNHGTLAYWSGYNLDIDRRHLVWIDLSGEIKIISKESEYIMSPKISGDGGIIAVDQMQEDGSYEIVLYDPVLGTSTDFVTQQSAITPVWSPDFSTISYYQLDEPQGVYTKPVDLSYDPRLLFNSDEVIHLGNWSKDGRYLVFRSQKGAGYFDSQDGSVYYLDFINEGKGVEVFYPILSPDGKWLAYTSDDDRNKDHVYIVPFPGPGRAHRISVNEGHAPVWSPDMKSIYFIGQNDLSVNVSKADIFTSPQFSSAEPKVLFEGKYTTQYTIGSSGIHQYGNTGMFDIHPDGDRFIMQQSDKTQSESAQSENILKVIVNWPELIE